MMRVGEESILGEFRRSKFQQRVAGAGDNAPDDLELDSLLDSALDEFDAATEQAHWFDNAGRVVLAPAHATAR